MRLILIFTILSILFGGEIKAQTSNEPKEYVLVRVYDRRAKRINKQYPLNVSVEWGDLSNVGNNHPQRIEDENGKEIFYFSTASVINHFAEKGWTLHTVSFLGTTSTEAIITMYRYKE